MANWINNVWNWHFVFLINKIFLDWIDKSLKTEPFCDWLKFWSAGVSHLSNDYAFFML